VILSQLLWIFSFQAKKVLKKALFKKAKIEKKSFSKKQKKYL